MKSLYLLEGFDVLSYSGSVHNIHMPYPLGFTLLLQIMLGKEFGFSKFKSPCLGSGEKIR